MSNAEIFFALRAGYNPVKSPTTVDKKKINYITGPTPGVIGSLQAVEAIKYLIGIGASLKNRMLFWDGLSMEFETISLKRNPGCKVCKNI